MSNPVLIELTRGGAVEVIHRGSIAIARPNGEIVASLGDIDTPVYPRSAFKCVQALPVVETGAAERYAFADAELALACASHSATPAHTDLAQSMLTRAGLGEPDLGCGAHDPVHEESARRLFAAGARPTKLHNNCSGKHAGMLCTCVHSGDAPAGYLDPAHPHQQRIVHALADLFGDGFDARRRGIDGCSAPNWSIPLRHLATGFARYITGERLAPSRRAAAARIAKACMARPDLVAGPDRLDTLLMGALPGRLFSKTGAEGVYCVALPALGIGVAMKIDDGNKRASEAVLAGLAAHLFPGTTTFGRLGPITNYAGQATGETRLAAPLSELLHKVA